MDIETLIEKIRTSRFPTVEYATLLSEHYGISYDGEDLKRLTKLMKIFGSSLLLDGVIKLLLGYDVVNGGFVSVNNLLAAILRNTAVELYPGFFKVKPVSVILEPFTSEEVRLTIVKEINSWS